MTIGKKATGRDEPAVEAGVTSSGAVELDESQLDGVLGGAVSRAVTIKFGGVDGESTDKDHKGGLE